MAYEVVYKSIYIYIYIYKEGFFAVFIILVMIPSNPGRYKCGKSENY